MRIPVLACAVQRRRFPVGASPTRQPRQTDATSSEGFGDWATYQLRKLFRNCRRRCTRKRRQNPAIASTRSYDKINREDILAHAYAQCRSNKGAPGVDGQDFADIETYGVERWLGELALALREE